MTKRLIALLFFPIAIALVSCNDPDKGKDKEYTLELSTYSIECSYEGITSSFTVDTNAESYELQGESDWFSYSVDETDKTKVHVTVEEMAEGDLREGKITVYVNEKLSKDVDIKQTGFQGTIYERNSLYRMNLSAGVSEVDFHEYIPRDVMATDLKFNEDGMLTSFVHTKSNVEETKVTYQLSYDSGKLVKIKNDEEGEFTIDLTYGDHGKYIPVNEIFNEIASSGYFMQHNLWLPAFIKNLSEVKLSTGVTYSVVVDGNSGSLTYEEEGGTLPEYHKYTFEGDFAKTVFYDLGWGITVTATYNVNATNGKILSITELDNDEKTVTLEFNDDRINTLKKIDSPYTGVNNYEYNSKLDMTKSYLDGAAVNEIEYTYDDHDNWVFYTDSKTSKDKERKITY